MATRTTAASAGYRGGVIVMVGLATAGMAVALRGSLSEAILAPLFLGGGVVVIIGFGLGGYDYSRRSGATLLERGIWQPVGHVSPLLPVRGPIALIVLGSDANAGDPVVVTHLPAGWLDDLPPEDQAAIAAVIGRPISVLGVRHRPRRVRGGRLRRRLRPHPSPERASGVRAASGRVGYADQRGGGGPTPFRPRAARRPHAGGSRSALSRGKWAGVC